MIGRGRGGKSVRGSPIEGRERRRSVLLSPRFLETWWKKRVFQFAGASRALTVSFTTLRGKHIVSSGKYDTHSAANNVAKTAPYNMTTFECFACDKDVNCNIQKYRQYSRKCHYRIFDVRKISLTHCIVFFNKKKICLFICLRAHVFIEK